jgi:hypothetical protein
MLHLISQSDVLVVTVEAVMQLVRVDLEPLLSIQSSNKKGAKGKWY